MFAFRSYVPLAAKMAIGLVTVFFVTGVAVSYMATSILQDSFREQLEKEIFIFLEQVAGNLDKVIVREIEKANVHTIDLAKEEVFLDANSAWEDFSEEEIRQIIQERDEEWRHADTELKTVLLNNEISDELRDEFELREYYLEHYGYPVYEEVFVTDTQGVVVGLTQETSDYYQADEKWWQEAREKGFFVGPLEFDKSTETFSIEIAVRVDSEDGEFLGVMKSVFNPSELVGVMQDAVSFEDSIGFAANITAVTPQGEVVYSSSGEFEFLEDITQTRTWNRIIDRSDEGTKSFLVSENTNKLYAVAEADGYDIFSGLGWFVLFEQDAEVVFSALDDSISRIIQIAASVTIGLIVLMTVFFYFIFIRPIKRLTESAKAITSGDIEKQAPTNSNDEIGRLGEEFNLMTLNLREANNKLKQKVDEKTKKLNNNVQELEKSQQALLATLEDVNEQKKNVESLTRRLKIAQKAARFGVWDWNVKKNVLTWDDQMHKLYGVNHDDFEGAYDAWLASIHPEDKKMAEKAIQDALDDRAPYDITFRIIRPDNGRVRYIQANAIVLRNKNNEPVRMIGVNYDVTHEQEVDRAKSEFVSLASHQLRTPLSSIGWYTEMLMDGDAGRITKKQKEYLQEIYKGNGRMVALVNALLNVSRLELGTFAIDPKEVDPAAVLQEEIEALQKQLEDRNTKLETDIDPKIGTVQADPSLLSIIFQNFLTNALKYSPRDTSIMVSLKKIKKGDKVKDVKANESGYLYTVKDEGYGIPENQKDKIFEKLFRADNVKRHDTDGTGLGLYIIKSIVEEVQGKVWFTSKEGKGSTFYVYIPEVMKRREGNRAIEKVE